MDPYRQLFRLNVGFIAHESVGYSREFVFDIPEIRLEDLVLRQLGGVAVVSRTTQGLLFQVEMHALTPTVCVRCLTPFDLPLQVQFTELYAFSPRQATGTTTLFPESGVVDLASLVREYMWLEVPIQPLCRPDCKGLCPVCGANQNETTCHHDLEEIDPRLAVLKTLLGE